MSTQAGRKTGLRLLPLVAVGVGGLLALKAVAGAEALPNLLGSPAHAAGGQPAKPPVGATAPLPAKGVTIRPAAPAAACLPTAAILAKEAGMSPSELRVLQSLGERRGQLDAREQAMDTQIKLLSAAELKLDAKIKALTALKGELQALTAQSTEQQKAENDRLVSVYEKMKPKAAAPIFAALSDEVRLPVAAKLRPQTLAAILAEMEPGDAKKLTERLAARLARADSAAARAQAVLGGARPAPPPAG
jgi:flagellar motility protein MotE (MotC chaperone)